MLRLYEEKTLQTKHEDTRDVPSVDLVQVREQ